jgi:hypothetical protein
MCGIFKMCDLNREDIATPQESNRLGPALAFRPMNIALPKHLLCEWQQIIEQRI